MYRSPAQCAQDAHEDDHVLSGGVDMGYEDWLTDLDWEEHRHHPDLGFAPFCPVTGANAAGAAPPQSAGRATCMRVQPIGPTAPRDGSDVNDSTTRPLDLLDDRERTAPHAI